MAKTIETKKSDKLTVFNEYYFNKNLRIERIESYLIVKNSIVIKFLNEFKLNMFTLRLTTAK